MAAVDAQAEALGWAADEIGKVCLSAFAEKLEASPIAQALEGTFLPPDVEQMIAAMITKLAEKFPPPVPDAAPGEAPE
jgi:hypothetical protein